MSYPPAGNNDSLPPAQPVRPSTGIFSRKPLILGGLAAALVAVVIGALIFISQPSGTTARNGIAQTGTVTPFPTYPPLPTVTQGPTLTPTPSPPPCNKDVTSKTQVVGNMALTVTPGLVLANLHYALPDNTALKPLALPPRNTATGQYGDWPQNVNPEGPNYLFDICNTSQSRSIGLTGVQIAVSGFTAYAGSLNQWGVCDGDYTGGQVQSGGCGGSVGEIDERLQATFPASYAAGQTVTATLTDGHPLPFLLAPGQALSIMVVITPPKTAGTYTFTVNAQTADGDLAQAVNPLLLAPVAHQWTGQACTASAMQSQIPHDNQTYICPNS